MIIIKRTFYKHFFFVICYLFCIACSFRVYLFLVFRFFCVFCSILKLLKSRVRIRIFRWKTKWETITYIWMKSSALKQTAKATHGIVIRSNNGNGKEKKLSFNSIENVIMIVLEYVYFFPCWLMLAFSCSFLLGKKTINWQVDDHWMNRLFEHDHKSHSLGIMCSTLHKCICLSERLHLLELND